MLVFAAAGQFGFGTRKLKRSLWLKYAMFFEPKDFCDIRRSFRPAREKYTNENSVISQNWIGGDFAHGRKAQAS